MSIPQHCALCKFLSLEKVLKHEVHAGLSMPPILFLTFETDMLLESMHQVPPLALGHGARSLGSLTAQPSSQSVLSAPGTSASPEHLVEMYISRHQCTPADTKEGSRHDPDTCLHTGSGAQGCHPHLLTRSGRGLVSSPPHPPMHRKQSRRFPHTY